MTWTDEMPTRDGWYWWRPADDEPAEVVQVREWRDRDGNAEMMVLVDSEWRSAPTHYEWSNAPIPEPATRTA